MESAASPAVQGGRSRQLEIGSQVGEQSGWNFHRGALWMLPMNMFCVC